MKKSLFYAMGCVLFSCLFSLSLMAQPGGGHGHGGNGNGHGHGGNSDGGPGNGGPGWGALDSSDVEDILDSLGVDFDWDDLDSLDIDSLGMGGGHGHGWGHDNDSTDVDTLAGPGNGHGHCNGGADSTDVDTTDLGGGHGHGWGHLDSTEVAAILDSLGLSWGDLDSLDLDSLGIGHGHGWGHDNDSTDVVTDSTGVGHGNGHGHGHGNGHGHGHGWHHGHTGVVDSLDLGGGLIGFVRNHTNNGNISNKTTKVLSISVAPNPTADVVSIYNNENIVSYSLYSSDGRLLDRNDVNSQELVLSLAQYGKGVYLLQIQTDTQGVSTHKLMVR